MGLLVAHGAATWFMCGLIWVVQVVHYPLFAQVGRDRFAAYEQGHTTRIGRLLVLPALAEIVTAALVAVLLPRDVPLPLALAGGAILVFIWVMTALVQAPQHAALSRGFSPDTHRRLVGSNWWRTMAWSGRAILAAVMLI